MKKATLLLTVVAGVATIFGAGVAKAQDTVYVSDSGNDTVAIISGSGTTTIGNSSILYTPEGIAINSQGDVFIANYGTYPDGGYIEEYDPTTKSFSTFAVGLANPKGLAFDSQGNLYVANYVGGTVTEFKAGTDVGTPFATNLVTPNGIAIDQFGDLYVSMGTGINDIARIDPGGSTSFFQTTGAALSGPAGDAFGPDGDLYVANSTNNTVEAIALNLKGTTAVSGSSVNQPYDVAFDSDGNLYVTDYSSDTVTEYNAAGQLINTLSGLCGPTFVAIEDGTSLAVPEPSTYALLFAGVGALYYFQRRRNATLMVKA